MSDATDARTPAQIQADIETRRADLADTLDEIGVRLHPSTIVGDAKAKVASAVDQTAGRAFVALNRAANGVRAQFVSDTGAPRLERVIPVALLSVGLIGLCVSSKRCKK
ncbi:DUF3618 domain-containing protein [Streptomyces sp. NBC_01387]|uniref:DUF3618 domain-containing protein n=1 Tax=unclassified Streptomyces TaxID=2593676 RepID=UPI00202408C9|nr:MULTISPECIES: DUF3618 domain-containing protein [unclassified Streptomyces]MCX4550853.1 DUF3618 domain-containing protein [Streptomyces sp. NBC_01500]WSC22277.1 DUF3618 domain-containing protein [Streptomyces sp. NBC_01766]